MNRSSNRPARLSYEQFESRKLLASFTGTEGDDSISILISGDSVDINLNGVDHMMSLSDDPLLEIDSLGGFDDIDIIVESTASLDLAMREAELEFVTPSGTIILNGSEDVDIDAASETNSTALVSGNYGSIRKTFSIFRSNNYTLKNENLSVVLSKFDSIDLANAPSMPIISGDFFNGEVVVDHTGDSGSLAFKDNKGAANSTTIYTGSNSFHVSGEDGIETLSFLAPDASTIQVGGDTVRSPLGDITYQQFERLNVFGNDDSSTLQQLGDDDFRIEDERVLMLSDSPELIEIFGFSQFEMGSAEGTLQDNRTFMRSVTASFDLVNFVGTAEFSLQPNPSVEVLASYNKSKLTLIDTVGQEQLGINSLENVAKLVGDQGEIKGRFFSEVEVNSSGGEDNAIIREKYSDAYVETNGYRFVENSGTNMYSISLNGFKTIRTDSSSQLPDRFHGTDNNDSFLATFLSNRIALQVNEVETLFISDGNGKPKLVGGTGVDYLQVYARTVANPQLTQNRFSTDGPGVDFAEFENQEVRGLADSAITITGTEQDEIFRFSDGTASMTNEEGSQIRAFGFGSYELNADSGNDVAYLKGPDHRTNTFLGNSSFGRLTTPNAVITARNFDLVSATASGSDDTATFVGTDADEQLYAFPRQGRFVSPNFTFNASGFANINAEAGNGNDYANIADSEGNDSLVARPGFARLQAIGVGSVSATDFETVRSVSSAGDDHAEFEGSLLAERFLASDRFGRLNGDGYSLIAVSYPNVTANGNGGVDEAYLSDSLGDDSFVGTPDQSYLAGTGFKNTAVNFDEVIAFSSGGRDSAQLNGSIGNDTFYGNPNLANLTGDRFFQFASGFEFVRAFGGGGDDSATLRDSDLVDRFFANDEMASLRNENFHNEVWNFSRVKGVSVSGPDAATFEGSDRVDLFHGHRDSSYIEGDGFRRQVNGFSLVTAIGLVGEDIANLYDSDEDERFSAQGNNAWLRGETYRLQVFDFESVNAFGFQGGTNEFAVDDPDFEVSRFGSWEG